MDPTLNTTTVLPTISTMMTLKHLGLPDYAVFALMLSVSIGIGMYFGFFSNVKQSTEEYLLGGRQMKTLPIAISLIASQLSGVSIMATPAEMYSYGTLYWLVVPTMFFIILIINEVFAPVFYVTNATNCYEYLEHRFSGTVKKMVTASYVLNGLIILPVFMFIPSLAFAQVTPVNIHTINAVCCGVCVFYTMLGGIKAVVYTDVLQAGVMISSVVLVLYYGITSVGGVDEVWSRASQAGRIKIFEFSTDPTVRQTFWNQTFGNFCLWCGYIGLNQSCVQRIVALPSLMHAKRALWIFYVGFFVLMSFNCFTGIVMYAKYHGCDPVKLNIVSKADKLMPYFVQDVVGHLNGMPGVFISCVFSAALSTLSASLNSLSGIIYSDYIRPLKMFNHTEEHASLTMKSLVIMIGVFCAAAGILVEKFSSMLQLVMTLAGIAQGPVLGVFLFGMLYPWGNKHGALWGVVGGTCIVGWLAIGAQFLISSGDLKYATLPTSIEACHYMEPLYGNFTFDFPSVVMEEVPFSMYRISYGWYGLIATFMVWIIGVPVSHLTGAQSLKTININLIAPWAQSLIPIECRHVAVPVNDEFIVKNRVGGEKGYTDVEMKDTQRSHGRLQDT